ncbi:MAG: hypothetical protein ABSE16_14615 [Verrucomicrobiota bacterium]|jgi:hypothetical protein
MTIAEQLKRIEGCLAGWVKQYSGSAKVANDVPHLFTILGVNPGAPRCAILFQREEPQSERFDDVAGRMHRTYWIAVSRGRGFMRQQGMSLTEGVAGGPPMFQLAEEAREIVRAIRDCGTADEPLPYYRGIALMEFEGVTTDTYRIELILAADIPEQLP